MHCRVLRINCLYMPIFCILSVLLLLYLCHHHVSGWRDFKWIESSREFFAKLYCIQVLLFTFTAYIFKLINNVNLPNCPVLLNSVNVHLYCFCSFLCKQPPPPNTTTTSIFISEVIFLPKPLFSNTF